MDNIQGIAVFLDSFFISGDLSGEARMALLIIVSYFMGYCVFIADVKKKFPFGGFSLTGIGIFFISYLTLNKYFSGNRSLILATYFCTFSAWLLIGLTVANVFSRRKTERLLEKAVVIKQEKGEDNKIWIGDISDFEVRLLRYFLYYEVYKGEDKAFYSLGKILGSKNQCIETGRNQVEWNFIMPYYCKEYPDAKDSRLFIRSAWPVYDSNEVVVVDGEKLNIKSW